MRNSNLPPRFSWTFALLSSGICYLAISGFMELLGKGFPSIFMWIGMSSMTLGSLAALGSIFFEEVQEKGDQVFNVE